MFRKALSTTCFAALILAVVFALNPSSAVAQRGGGGGSGGGGSGGGGGSRDLPNLSATLAPMDIGDPSCSGQAVAGPNPAGDGQSFSMQVTNIATATVVSVYINGAFVGYINLHEFGDGASLYTIGYYGGINPVNVPIVHAGDEIDVYDADDGTLLLSATFQ